MTGVGDTENEESLGGNPHESRILARLSFKQSRFSMLTQHIYILGRFVNFWWFLGISGDKKFFLRV